MSLLQHGYTKDNLKFLLISYVTNSFAEYYHYFIKYASLLNFKNQESTRLILVENGNKGILLLETFMNIASLKIIENKGLDIQSTLNQIVSYLSDTIKSQISSVILANQIDFKLFFYIDHQENIPIDYKINSNSAKSDIFGNTFVNEKKEVKYNFNFQSDWSLVKNESNNKIYSFKNDNELNYNTPTPAFPFNNNLNLTFNQTPNTSPFPLNHTPTFNPTAPSTTQSLFNPNQTFNQPSTQSLFNPNNNNNNTPTPTPNTQSLFNPNNNTPTPTPNTQSLFNPNSNPALNTQSLFNPTPTFNQNHTLFNNTPTFPNNLNPNTQTSLFNNSQPSFNVNNAFNNPNPNLFNWNNTSNKDTKSKKNFSAFPNNPLNN